MYAFRGMLFQMYDFGGMWQWGENDFLIRIFFTTVDS